MTASENRPALESLRPTQLAAIGLALVSGSVHLVLGVGFLPHWMGVAFLVATAGFVAGVALVLVDYHRRLVYLVGVPFTAGQVVLWYALNQPVEAGGLSAVELVDKVAQILLIVLLVVLYHRES